MSPKKKVVALFWQSKHFWWRGSNQNIRDIRLGSCSSSHSIPSQRKRGVKRRALVAQKILSTKSHEIGQPSKHAKENPEDFRVR